MTGSAIFKGVKKRAQKAFLMRLRIENLERIRFATIIGLIMGLGLLVLDYIRFVNGRFGTSPLYFLLFLNHISLFVLIFPLALIYKNRETVAVGRYKYTYPLIVSWTVYVSLVTLIMAILSIIERGSIAMYGITILVVNFIVIMLHTDRVLLNVVIYLIMSCAIVFIQGDHLEMMVVNFLEATSVTILGFAVATNLFNNVVMEFNHERELIEKNETIRLEQERSHDLLLNILPAPVAAELIIHKKVQPRDYSSATVMMLDFKDFSKKSNLMTPVELVDKIDFCFSSFDRIIQQYGLEKIKTLGDGYLCVGGVPTPTMDHPEKVIYAALEILDFLDKWKRECLKVDEQYFEGRVGIHTGPLIAGVVGRSKFAFDIWGDTVNIAARLESNGEAGRVNISHSTYQLVGKLFSFTHRGKVPVKNQEPIDMYFLEEIR